MTTEERARKNIPGTGSHHVKTPVPWRINSKRPMFHGVVENRMVILQLLQPDYGCPAKLH